MGLSSDLISQFVKVTNDQTETKTEETVYGTIVEYGDKNYVQIDGSELLTPISTTTNVKPGERVTVMIKNHTATVTGNISSPAARMDDITDVSAVLDKISEFEIVIAGKVDTDDLVAANARIDDLQADNVTIKEQLTVAEGDIDNLQTNVLTVSEKLTAAEADIDNLEATKLDVEIAKATYATITNLEATNADLYNLNATYGEFVTLTTDKFTAIDSSITNLEANKLDAETASITYATISDLDVERGRIDVLEAGVADIDTLIFGSASGNVIQTSFANAVIAQLGNAQIKSAMIESISADKITAGDIITNNVRVMSEDGKLLISDETIQISDDTRVRVQIGKDSAGDYSISIWDADGNLMFSEGGITDSAIKEAIIRNDMVSDTANIAAHKLDIDSLFEEINGSTNTIKSTRVYLDEEGQTLDVVFTDLTTQVDDLEETVTSQGTSISVIQGQISSKVWQQDIDSANETLITQYSSLEQTVDGINVIVANHTTDVAAVQSQVAELDASLSGLTSKVSNLQIGGRNLILDSDLSGITGYIGMDVNTDERMVTFTVDTLGLWNGFNLSLSDYALKNAKGSKITLSGEYQVLSELTYGTTNPWVGYQLCVERNDTTGGSTQYLNWVGGTSCPTEVMDDWKQFVGTYELTDYDVASLNITVLFQDVIGSIAYRNLKIEFGNISTDWSLAPEDMATNQELENVNETAESANETARLAESLITQLSNCIAMLVTDGNGTSLMTQTDEGWTFSTADIQTAINKTTEGLNELSNEVGSTNEAVDILQQAVEDLGSMAEYVKIGTYEDEPCIELGEGDSDFKLLITNTRIMFMEGSSVPAYINNKSLYISKAIVEEELQQGEFVWKARSNGNLGLVWKGVTS